MEKLQNAYRHLFPKNILAKEDQDSNNGSYVRLIGGKINQLSGSIDSVPKALKFCVENYGYNERVGALSLKCMSHVKLDSRLATVVLFPPGQLKTGPIKWTPIDIKRAPILRFSGRPYIVETLKIQRNYVGKKYRS